MHRGFFPDQLELLQELGHPWSPVQEFRKGSSFKIKLTLARLVFSNFSYAVETTLSWKDCLLTASPSWNQFVPRFLM